MATKGKDGIELLEDKPYEDKIYHLEGYLPGWIKAVLPSSALKLEEESYDCFPYSKTILTNPFLGGRFSFTIESFHVDNDDGKIDNALNLPPDVLQIRQVRYLDICVDELQNKENYRADEDPKLVKPTKANRGPLEPGWQSKAKPIMCAYKVVTVKVSFWPFSGKAENFIMKTEEEIFLRFHKQIFCWLDEWFDLDINELIEKEAQIYKDMNNKLQRTPLDAASSAAALPEASDDGSSASEEKRTKKKKKKGKQSNGSPVPRDDSSDTEESIESGGEDSESEEVPTLDITAKKKAAKKKKKTSKTKKEKAV